MGSPNHIIALQQFLTNPQIDPCKELVLEVGSKNYGNTADFKTALGISKENYIGVDMEDGENVDLVLDFTQPFDVIDRALGGKLPLHRYDKLYPAVETILIGRKKETRP